MEATFVVDLANNQQEFVERFMKFFAGKKIKVTVEELPENTPIIDQQFHSLFSQWKSSIDRRNSFYNPLDNPDYQSIIKLGHAAVPLILSKLPEEPNLLDALYEITGEDPVPAEHNGYIMQVVEDWLNWGKSKGFKS
jgi:hypothetical protein